MLKAEHKSQTMSYQRQTCLAAVIALATIMTAGETTAQVQAEPVSRRLVLCLDGTWNSAYDKSKRDDGTKVLKPTNTLKVCRAVLPTDASGREQIAYYDIGVGSLAEYPGQSNRLLYFFDRVLGGAWGAGFEGNVEDALHFLVLNHQEGDEVFLFGFSRGAATAQAVTRFLDWAGGLPQKEDAYFLPQLFRAYVVAHGAVEQRAPALRQIEESLKRDKRKPLRPFQHVNVKYLGVWDTVMALGSRFQAKGQSTSSRTRSFHAGKAPAACVHHARQALAVDEARLDFRPEIWTEHLPDQNLQQRWFAGVHSNIGGGYVNDGLANIALHWVVEGAMQEGLQTDKEFLAHYRRYPLDSLYSSSSLLYRMLDALRFRTGAGKRRLVGTSASANLTLDASVVKRLRVTPDRLEKGSTRTTKAYRPENVLLFLACQPDLDAYLLSIGLDDLHENPLPDDVRRRIEELRPRCTGAQATNATEGNS